MKLWCLSDTNDACTITHNKSSQQLACCQMHRHQMLAVLMQTTLPPAPVSLVNQHCSISLVMHSQHRDAVNSEWCDAKRCWWLVHAERGVCWSGNVAAYAVAKSMLVCIAEAWLNAFEMLTH
jgi:hypothetical protein